MMKTYNVFYTIKTKIWLIKFYLSQELIVSLKIKILYANTYKYRNKDLTYQRVMSSLAYLAYITN